MGSERLVLGGRYRLLRHLGGGGMSEVFLAEQRSLKRPVALKVLKRTLLEQPQMRARFKREARLLSSVAHPAVVRVIDFEADSDEGTVLVLEYAEGQTLEEALAQGALEPERAARLLLQLAEGLSAIHDQGIIHRDIKPHNVVLTPTPRGEQARLLDFGIARLVELHQSFSDTTGPHEAALSQVGQAVGTPAYVAPEQATASTVTPRTDVYAFGVLAFRVLTGALPFPGPTSMDFLEQHVRQKPPRLDEVAPHLAAWPQLVWLVGQCLEKSPDARPADGHALVEALRTLVPPSVIPLSTQTRLVLSAVTTQTLGRVQGGLQSVGSRARALARDGASALFGLDRQLALSLAVAGVVLLGAGVAVAAWPPSASEAAAAALHRGAPAEALQLVDAAWPRAGAEAPRLLPLKVAALQRLGQAEAWRALARATPYQALFLAPDALLEALAEEAGGPEVDGELNAWLHLLPPRRVDAAFARLAQEPPSRRQWGALRWLDSAGRAGALDLAGRYAAALVLRSCAVRTQAATRLGELSDRRAIPALRQLSETPKEEGPAGAVDCGQDEAAEAIRKLNRGR